MQGSSPHRTYLRVQLNSCVIGQLETMHKLLPLHSRSALPRLLHSKGLSQVSTSCTHENTLSKRNIISTAASSQRQIHVRRAFLPTTHRTTHRSTHIPHTVRLPPTVRKMSSDADYASFLDKANQDTGAAQQQSSSSKKSYGTKSVDTAIPKALEQVEEYYVSDADEPFEPVALKYAASSISACSYPTAHTAYTCVLHIKTR